MTDEDPEIKIVKTEKAEEEAEEKEEQIPETEVKCPICGTVNEAGAEECKLCKTMLVRTESGKLKIESPKISGDILLMIDIEDPLTRKTLEDLALIPGVSRMKAIYLFQSGITSIEEFVEKAFHGERLSKNFTRMVSNKILMSSIKTEEAEERIPCPSCSAPNKMDASNCGVCGFEIEKEMSALDMENVASKLSGTAEEVFGELLESEDFEVLPDEMKAQVAMILESDDLGDVDELPDQFKDTTFLEEGPTVAEQPPELVPEEPEPEPEEEDEDEDEDEEDEEPFAFEQEASPEESPEIEPEPEVAEAEPKPAEEEPEAVEEPPEPEPEPVAEEPPRAVAETKAEPEPEPVAEEPPKPELSPSEKMAAQKKKIRETLLKKIDDWTKAGYDVTGLDEHLEDIKAFKAKAKEALKKGKIVKEQYQEQLEIWKEKGFDVSELEPLLDTDIVAFKEKAADILKKQKE